MIDAECPDCNQPIVTVAREVVCRSCNGAGRWETVLGEWRECENCYMGTVEETEERCECEDT